MIIVPASTAVAITLLVTGCGPAASVAPRRIPTDLVPDHIGQIIFKREPKAEAEYLKAGPESLVTTGQVYTVRHDDIIEGSVQVALFKPKVDTSDLTDQMTNYCIDNPLDCTGHEALEGLQRSLGSGQFVRVHIDKERVYKMQLSDQQIDLWFPPGTQTMEMLILRKQFTAAASDALLKALIDLQHRLQPSPVPIPSPPVGTLPSPSSLPGFDLTSPSPSPSGTPGGT